jgi:LCP family protein required for cell wall assembly
LVFRLEVVKLWVSPSAIAALMSANLALLFYRWIAASDAYHSVSDTRTTRWMSRGALMVVAFVLVVPHLIFGYVAVTQYSLIKSVFGENVAISADPGPPSPNVEPDPLLATAIGGDDDSTATAAAPTVSSTTEPTSALWDGLERLNIVLLGADAGEGRRGLRTDTTIVVSIDPENGDASMFSVPRDLSNIPLPVEMGIWGCDCFPDLITHLYDAGINHPEAFPGPQAPPINGLKAGLGELFGLEIHYYALVTLEGFVDIVDALGGVTMEIPKTIYDETYPHENGSVENITIKEGTRHLDGHEALAYGRIRRHSDDFSRMHRQRCVLEAVASQTSPTELLLRFGSIAGALKRSLDTDIPEELLPDFIDLLPKVSTDRISTLRITRSEYKSGGAPGRTYYDTDRIRADAQALLANPQSARDELGLEDLDDTCTSE